MIAKLRTLGQAELALAAVDIRVDGYAIAHLDVGHRGTDRGHNAGVLMTKHDWRDCGCGTRTACIQIVIRAAYAGIRRVDQYFIRKNLRGIQILDLEFLHTSEHQSLHDCSFRQRKRFCTLRI